MTENKEASLDDDTLLGGEIKLVAKDQTAVSVEKKYAFVSNLIKTSVEQDPTASELPLQGVAGDILKLLVEYMNHHKGTEAEIVEKPLRAKEMKAVCKDAWDANFIDTVGENRQQLYDLILAANYMDIKSLLHLGCAKVASLIKGQPLEKIKDILAGKKPTEAKVEVKKATS